MMEGTEESHHQTSVDESPSGRFSVSRFQPHDNTTSLKNLFDAPLNRSPNGLSASRPTSRSALTPSRTARSSGLAAKTLKVDPSGSRPCSSSAVKMPPRSTPPPPPSSSSRSQQTFKHQTPRKSDWTVDKIQKSISVLSNEVKLNHAKLVHFSIRSTAKQVPLQQRHLSSVADLADLTMPVAEAIAPGQITMTVKLKQHGSQQPRANKETKKIPYEVICIKSDKERVPKYRFHHVEISKNILTPNTMLKFVPHLRDMKENEEERFKRWVNELEAMDAQSGFKVTGLDRREKLDQRRKDEIAAEILPYMDRWIAKIGMEDCSKSALIVYVTKHQSNKDDKMTPQQKNDLINKHSEDELSPRAIKAAKMFTEAFDRVWKDRNITLKDVMQLDESAQAILESKKQVKENNKPEIELSESERLVETVENFLASYTVLGCLICYSHSCEHGEYDGENHRRTFCVDLHGQFGDFIRQRLAQQTKERQSNGPPGESAIIDCRNSCWVRYGKGNEFYETVAWKDNELMILRSLYTTLGAGKLKEKVPCIGATILGRLCWDVYRQLSEMNLVLPFVAPIEPQKVKQLNWYDRYKKVLVGDWQEHTNTHEHARRELRDPCLHSGPCGKGCPCYDAKLLCERFCRCTVDNCAYKFTGCACHSSGKTCLQRQKEGRPCICVQLNRECDPVLCKCGAFERADPRNANDKVLHSTGCQNVLMQRGASKAVLLGQSQLEGCGYGLFAGEDIAQDEFVIEYLGELITHDEGVRREARRGDVFDEGNNSSYLFTLLDVEGIWVDAAIYGNLSRYINHALEHAAKGCNITPKILYVNGEFRIKFTAIRDIKAGEELFFNYGENFPNLTKKLLESGEGADAEGGAGSKKNKGGRPKLGEVPRKTTTRKKYGPRKEAPEPNAIPMSDDSDDEYEVGEDEPLLFIDDDDKDSDYKGGRSSRGGRGRGDLGVGRGGRKRKRVESIEEVSPAGEPSKGTATVRGSRRKGNHGGPRRGAGRRARGSGGAASGLSRRGGGAQRALADPTAASAGTTAMLDLKDPESPKHASASITAAPTATAMLPTNPPAVATEATTSNAVTPRSRSGRRRKAQWDNDNESVDSLDTPTKKPPGSAHGSLAQSLRKRPANRQPIEDSDEDMHDVDQDEEDEYDDDGEPIDRSRRKRQRPARYREGP